MMKGRDQRTYNSIGVETGIEVDRDLDQEHDDEYLPFPPSGISGRQHHEPIMDRHERARLGYERRTYEYPSLS